MSLTQLSTIAYWKIRARLLRVPGVVNVAIWGERLQEEHVDVDPARLRAQGVSLDQVMNATADSLDAGLLRYADFGNVIGTGGFVDTANQRLGIRHVLPITTPADLGEDPGRAAPRPAGAAAATSRTSSRATSRWPATPSSTTGPGLLLVDREGRRARTRSRSPRASTPRSTSCEPGLPGIDDRRRRSSARPTSSRRRSTTSPWRCCSAACWSSCVLVAFLFEWRTALISLLAIPLSLMAAVLVLYLRGDTINTMILAGLVIAVGVVVDDAIIDVENIWRRLRERGDGTRPARAARSSSRRRSRSAARSGTRR